MNMVHSGPTLAANRVILDLLCCFGLKIELHYALWGIRGVAFSLPLMNSFDKTHASYAF